MKSKTKFQIQASLDASKTQIDRARIVIDHALEGVNEFMSIPAILEWAHGQGIETYLSVNALEQHVTKLTSGECGSINFISIRSKGLRSKGFVKPVIKAVRKRSKKARR
jgi:ferritin